MATPTNTEAPTSAYRLAWLAEDDARRELNAAKQARIQAFADAPSLDESQRVARMVEAQKLEETRRREYCDAREETNQQADTLAVRVQDMARRGRTPKDIARVLVLAPYAVRVFLAAGGQTRCPTCGDGPLRWTEGDLCCRACAELGALREELAESDRPSAAVDHTCLHRGIKEMLARRGQNGLPADQLPETRYGRCGRCLETEDRPGWGVCHGCAMYELAEIGQGPAAPENGAMLRREMNQRRALKGLSPV